MMNLKLKKFGRKGSKSEGSEGATASGDGSQTGQTTPSTPPEGSTTKGLGSRVPTNMPRNSLSFANINPATSTTRHTKERSSHSKSVRLPVENLPSMRDVPAADRQALFIKKLNFCSQLFDFTDPSKNTKEKDTKRQNLLELVDYITSGGGKFSEAAVEELTKMVAANLFRSFPPSPYDSTGGDSNIDVEEEEPTLDPAWPHLQVVYEFLLRFIISTDTDSKIASKYMDQNFIIKILKLFESEDPREREYLKTILHRIYGKFMAYRPFLRKAINNVLIHFVFETEKHNGIAELLEVLGSIINGFALPLKDEHKQFLNKVLIPLHKPKSLLAYHQQLAYCTTQFVEKDPKLAENVIRGLLKYWPVTNSPKEVLFLNELEELLEATKPEEFQKCMVPLFQRISQSINSPHFQVSERALFLWNNDHIVNLIAQNREVILPIIFSSLEKNVKEHWSQPVNGLTMNVRKIFLEMDPDLFKQCETRYYENLEKEKEAKKKREETWKRLEEAAAANSKA